MSHLVPATLLIRRHLSTGHFVTSFLLFRWRIDFSFFPARFFRELWLLFRVGYCIDNVIAVLGLGLMATLTMSRGTGMTYRYQPCIYISQYCRMHRARLHSLLLTFCRRCH